LKPSLEYLFGNLAKLKKHERHILINTCFGHFMSHFNMLVFPAIVLPLTKRLDMEMAAVLGMSFWMYLLFGCSALAWGMIADRWGGKILMRVYYAGAGLSGLAAAFWIDSASGLTMALAALGLFSGIYHPTGLGLISKEIKRVSVGMGINGMFGNLGLATAPLLTGVINWFWGPQLAYLFLGCMNLCGLLLMVSFPVSTSARTRQVEKSETNGMLAAFVVLLAAMMLGGIVYRAATVILPAYFELKNQAIVMCLSGVIQGDLSQNLVATTVTSLIFVIGMLGQYTGGRVAERFDPRVGYLVFFGITALPGVLMGISGNWILIGLALLYFFFLLGMQPIENTLVARFTPRRFHHSAFGTKFVLTFGVGALAVKIVAAIESRFYIEAVFFFIGAISALAIGVILVLIFKTRSRQEDKPVVPPKYVGKAI
jgi:MFS family permease